MDAVLAAVATAALNHHRNNPIVRDDDDLDLLGRPDRRRVARRLRACSAAYMALGASLLVIGGDGDRDHVLVGFLLWIAGTVLLLLSSVATRFLTVAAVAAGVAQTAAEELALAAALAIATGRGPGLSVLVL